jgi:hypothetical protein
MSMRDRRRTPGVGQWHGPYGTSIEIGPPDNEIFDRRRVDLPAERRAAGEPADLAGRQSIFHPLIAIEAPTAARCWGSRAADRIRDRFLPNMTSSGRYDRHTMVMLNIELARTIDQERNREIEASARRRRLMGPDPMLIESTLATASSAQAGLSSTSSRRPAPPAPSVASR